MTDGWVTFEGRIEPMVWGRSTYTILRIPAEVVAVLHPARRVMGEIAEHPVNLARTRAPMIGDVFLWTGKTLLDRIGIEPGERVEIRLRPAPDDVVDLDSDIDAALHGAGLSDRWQSLTPGRRRGLLHHISTAKTPPTRAKRIAKLLEELP